MKGDKSACSGSPDASEVRWEPSCTLSCCHCPPEALKQQPLAVCTPAVVNPLEAPLAARAWAALGKAAVSCEGPSLTFHVAPWGQNKSLRNVDGIGMILLGWSTEEGRAGRLQLRPSGLHLTWLCAQHFGFLSASWEVCPQSSVPLGESLEGSREPQVSVVLPGLASCWLSSSGLKWGEAEALQGVGGWCCCEEHAKLLQPSPETRAGVMLLHRAAL